MQSLSSTACSQPTGSWFGSLEDEAAEDEEVDIVDEDVVVEGTVVFALEAAGCVAVEFFAVVLCWSGGVLSDGGAGLGVFDLDATCW